MKITRQLKIYGQVQGVFFREFMCREAARLHVGGWVRNRADGSVEAVVQGEAAAVETLIEWAHRGPPTARVARVEINEAHGQFSGFTKRTD